MYFKDDLSFSKDVFSIIKPYIEKDTNSMIIDVEGAGDALKQLDINAGIDYMLVSNKGIRGLASRVQAGKSWRTFTVRARKQSGAKTEYEKRIDAINEGYIYPYYTMQAYADNDKIEYAICKTDDLYRLIQSCPNKVKKRSTTNAEFLVVNWSDLNCKIKTLSKV